MMISKEYKQDCIKFKKYIRNQKYIDRFEETKTAGVNIVMKNGLSDYVSRRCFSKIRKELK